jgi:hypothetical protein
MRSDEFLECSGTYFKYMFGPFVATYHYDRLGGLATIQFADGRELIGRGHKRTDNYEWESEPPTPIQIMMIRLYA